MIEIEHALYYFVMPYFLLIFVFSSLFLFFRSKYKFIISSLKALKKEKEKVEMERNRLRGMLDGISIPVWHRDSSFHMDDCNKAYVTMVEKNREEILGTDQELTSHKGKQQKLARLAADEKTLKSDLFHAVIGQSRVLMCVHEIFNGEHHVGFALDYTLLEKSQQSLKEHLDAQQSLLENLSTGIGVFGADTRLQSFNRAYGKISGCDEKWLETHPSLGEILEDMRARRRLPEYDNFPAYKKSLLYQFTNLTGTEEEMTYRPDGHAIRRVIAPYPKGGLVYMFEDVTDRLTMEEQYHTLMNVQRETLNSLYEGIVVFGSDYRIKLFNPAFLRVWGLPSYGALGDHLLSFFEKMRPLFQEEVLWEDHKQSIQTLLSRRVPGQGKILCQNQKSLEFKYCPLSDGAHLFSYVDITDQYKIELALREKNQALEEASSLKSQFIGHISYELRTPLNTIIGFAEILENHYFGSLTTQQHEYSQGILQASHQLLSLIDDLLDLAVIEAGDIELEVEYVSVEDLFQLVERRTQERVHRASLHFEVFIPSSLPLLKIDKHRIQHALCHLIYNSLKFTEKGGKITLGATQYENWVSLWVQDTGVGISERDKSRIFEKFEKGTFIGMGNSGAGIGLSLVKSLMELHRGRVRIESTYNVGTIVYCDFPFD